MASINPWGKPGTGRIGDITLFERNGVQLARTAHNKRTRKGRTPEAMRMRTRISNYTTAWRVMADAMMNNFEKAPGQTDLHRFLSLNGKRARVYLTQEEAAAHCCVADRFWVSEGSLQPIQVHEEEGLWVTDVPAGLPGPRFKTGDGLRMILLTQREREGMPFVEMRQALLMVGSDSLSDKMTHNGMLAFPKREGQMVAWVHLRQEGAQLLASTQRLAGVNPLLERYTGEEALRRAIDSYGAEEPIVEKSVVKEASPKSDIQLTDRQRFILALIEGDDTITIQRMSQKLKVTTRTVDRDLKALAGMGLLRREGGRKEGRWERLKC